MTITEQPIWTEEKQPRQEALTPPEWKPLIKASLKGNNLFPQSYFAQSVFVGAEMGSFLRQTDMPLSTFLRDEPPYDDIVKIMAAARKGAHAANDIQTAAPEPTKKDLHSIWEKDHRRGKGFLETITWLVTDDIKGIETRKPQFISNERFDQARTVPIFDGLLQAAATTIESPLVTDLSDRYRMEIHDFMTKHMPILQTVVFPPGYASDYRTFLRTIRGLLSEAAMTTKQGMSAYIEQAYPDHTSLARRITLSGIDDIFGEVRVENFNPSRRLLYS